MTPDPTPPSSTETWPNRDQQLADFSLGDAGEWMYDLAKQLFPICRSITGEGVRTTLAILQESLPALSIKEEPSGTRVCDWIVPDEWNIRDAFVLNEQGERVIDFQQHNLHVVGYSTPIDQELSREELDDHLYSLPSMPDAIPYVTSYYEPRWGFCLTDTQRQSLGPGRYRAVIDSTLEPGVLNYGELIIPGESSDEILLSTYVCHPSMANNELSGPVVTTMLARWLNTLERRRFSYRIVFVPETIGALVYISRHLHELQENVIAGFVLTCVGDDRCYSYIASPTENTLADRVAQHTLRHHAPQFLKYSFLDRGSDERQYCSPGVGLPVVSITRSKHKKYPEYHTSLDNLDLISPTGLHGAFDVYKKCLQTLEGNDRYQLATIGEPQLGRRGLYPSLSRSKSSNAVRALTDVLAYCDGNRDLIDIAESINRPAVELLPLVDQLLEHGLIRRCKPPV